MAYQKGHVGFWKGATGLKSPNWKGVSSFFCIDCKRKIPSRYAKRCMSCHLIYKKKAAHGRIIGVYCGDCGKELSRKKTIGTTGLCAGCLQQKFIPWNKGMKGLIPWNKGKSVFRNKEEYRIHKNKLRKLKRLQHTVQQNFGDRIRTLIRNCIRRNTQNRRKNTKTEMLIGCEIKKFIVYIEMLFEKDMSWENYGNGHGKWNIDHIYPVSRFDLNDIDQQKKAFHFTNCRPMWAIDNIKKGNNVC